MQKHLSHPIFKLIGEVADEMQRPCFVIGGFVRDIILCRPSKDIDVVTLGSGIELAEALCRRLGRRAHLAVFRNFGTAQVKYRNGNEQWEVEFVGARRESYSHDSRKPIVEDGTLQDDQNRRDFTINALALCLNSDRYGELVDPFDGIGDIKREIIRTPLDPDITFSDDPLRMMRAIRFATQLNFRIYPDTFDAIKRNKERIKIISRERIIDELGKIIRSDIPSRGFILLDESGLLPYICPELAALKGTESIEGHGHKDNFYHTLTVLDNVALRSRNEWLRWAALFHDIAKPRTKRYDPQLGWTFHNHNFVGAKMIPGIFRTMKLPLNDRMKYVQKMVELHMRPIVLAEEEVTDSAIRRLLPGSHEDFFGNPPERGLHRKLILLQKSCNLANVTVLENACTIASHSYCDAVGHIYLFTEILFQCMTEKVLRTTGRSGITGNFHSQPAHYQRLCKKLNKILTL